MASTGAEGFNRVPPARHLVLVLAGALAVALSASACDALPGGQEQARTPGPAQRSAAQVPPTDGPTLTRFYQQDLAWSDCGDNECARLTVPIDYANPEGKTLKLSVLKRAATRPSRRIGSLLVNPGGPGASGVGYVRAATFTKPVRRQYDIVGFDPRGVAASSPIKCLSDRELDAFLGADPTPDDRAEEQQFADASKVFANKCKAKVGPLLEHVSTIDVAKDLDILRAALGETKLDYLGKSYGTFIGATYADLFPAKVGKFVLDGVVPPDLTSTQFNGGQAQGFEKATRAYVRDCVGRSGCPLGDSLEPGMEKLREFFKAVDAKPLPLNDPYLKELTEGWATLGVAGPMYNPGVWGQLTDALRDAFAGDGDGLMALAGNYADRTSAGTYDGNLMQAIYAVNCIDRSAPSELTHYESDARSLSGKAPTWGPLLAWSTLPCGYWSVPSNNAPKKITAPGSGPIVVVGTTRDPATPYEWSQSLAADLENGHLITFDGDGHTAYMRAVSCVDDAIDAYLLKGTVPPANLRC